MNNALRIACSIILIVCLASASCSGVGDKKSPSTIADLDLESVTRILSWTSPGDDGSTGRATVYDVRFFSDAEVAALLGLPSVNDLDDVSFAEIEEAVRNNFADAVQLMNEPEPGRTGSTESFFLTRLDVTGSTRFFLAMTVRDEVGNERSPSNVVEGSTSLAFAEITSSEAGSCLGESVDSGDFNGDRVNDILIGDPCAGIVYLFLGGEDFTDRIAADGQFFDVAAGDTADVTIIGNPGDMFGASVAGIRNFDDDFSDEIAIGAPGFEGGRGRVFILFGSREFDEDAPVTIDLTGGDEPALMITGENPGDNFGLTLVEATGVLGNRVAILAGAPDADSGRGKVYVFRVNRLESDTRAADAQAVFTGETAGDMFGFSIAQTGDFDEDPFDDFAVGSPGAGKVYVFFGDEDLESKNLSSDTSDVVVIEGDAGDDFGFDVSGGEDLNDEDVDRNDGDERPELIIGAPGADMDTGSAFIYDGSAVESAKDTGNSPTFITELSGINPGGRFGASVLLIEDLNPEINIDIQSEGNIIDPDPTNADFAVGAPGASQVFLFFGQTNLPGSIEAGNADVTLPQPGDAAPGGEFGRLLVNLGDVTDEPPDNSTLDPLDSLEDIAVGGLGFIRVEY